MKITTRRFLERVRAAGGELVVTDSEVSSLNQDAIAEAKGGGLLTVNEGSAWNCDVSYTLTRNGRRFFGEDVPENWIEAFSRRFRKLSRFGTTRTIEE